eukprot:3155272-Rhodomonas_salina.1
MPGTETGVSKAVWCAELTHGAGAQHCYVLVTKGLIFQRNATGASPHARAKAAQLTAAFVQ